MVKKSVLLTLLLPVLTLPLLDAPRASSVSARHAGVSIAGVGSTLVNPLVQQYVSAVDSSFGYSLTYAAVGSGTGIADISARMVDFGASDAPLDRTQTASCHGCVEIPWALTATTLSYNIPGIPNRIRLDGPTIAKIFLGKITTWNNQAIARLNPKLHLPSTPITPVHRSDGSGDTYAFTDYLARISSSFKHRVGIGTLLNWPGGIGANGNPGVAEVIASTPGAIGYLSAAYTVPNRLKVAAIENTAGGFATPGLRGISAAAKAFPEPISTAGGVEMHIVNPPKSAGKLAYPVSTYSYIIVPRETSKAVQLRKLILWALTVGAKTYGPTLVFVPTFPTEVLAASKQALRKLQCPPEGCAGT